MEASPVTRAQVVDDRLGSLVDAITPLSADLELPDVLSRIVSGACELLGTRYGALGVLGRDGRSLSGFYTHGITPEEGAAIGPPPMGHGVLGLLLTDPRPLRLHDLTAHPQSVGFPANHPPMRTLLGAPIRIRDRIFGDIYVAEKLDGGVFTSDDEALLVSLASAAGAALDNARLLAQSEIRQQWSVATSELVQSLLESESDDPSVALMAAQVRELSDALVTAVAVLDPAGRLEIRAIDRGPASSVPSSGEPSGAILPGRQWEELLEARQPLLQVPGGPADPRARPAEQARAVLGLDATTAVALVPLGTGPRGIGVLITGWERQEESTARDALPLQAAYAVQAGVAILAAQAHADRGRVALLEERERIAREMHDNVIQQLFATGLSLQSAVPLAQHPVVRTRVSKAVDDLDRAIRQIRQAIFELHREDPGESLLASLRGIAESYAASLGFVPDVTVSPGLAPMPEQLRADVVAVVREGLANVARHAHAGSATVRVDGSGGSGGSRGSGSSAGSGGSGGSAGSGGSGGSGGLSVDVVDDGIGFDPAEARSGLVNLRNRATAHGGSLEIRTGGSAGTALRWHVPRIGSREGREGTR
ncbi:MAG TPA: GAF domain-containing protein [Intrasporangium sp.]|uniref:GAF domain-containing sensor histidine kinase n=1 Tax=Intrasporangium sp. TaxID=1925024 RepID=UPI002B473854|nr:GAF domain-containing protein [Intrasporangium sp.]HKX65886.1 GAF domain-containing protein [Intrasporangium sp.]